MVTDICELLEFYPKLRDRWEGAHFVLLVFRKGQINFRSFQASNIIQINGAMISKMFENHWIYREFGTAFFAVFKKEVRDINVQKKSSLYTTLRYT